MKPADVQAVDQNRRSMRLGAQMARDRILQALRDRVVAIDSQLWPALTRDDAVEAQALAMVVELIVEDELRSWP